MQNRKTMDGGSATGAGNPACRMRRQTKHCGGYCNTRGYTDRPYCGGIFPGGSGIRLAQCQHGVHEKYLYKRGRVRPVFEDGQQKQANQIRAIRTFIQQEVDYIVLAPVTETGWDTVLREAKDAGIPVVIVDRKVDVEDDSLFTCFVGSDFELEGLKMSEWLNSFSSARELHRRIFIL